MCKIILASILIIIAHPLFSMEEKDSINSLESTMVRSEIKFSLEGLKKEYGKLPRLKNLYVGGYYRLYGYHRYMNEGYDTYSNTIQDQRRLFVGDGYREPLLLLFLSGNPTVKTNFSTQLFFLPNYNGPGYSNTDFNLQLGVNFSGGIITDKGKFDIQVGGINWTRLSPFTLWQNEGYHRYSIFDRTPWEDAGNVNKRYKDFYNLGTINQDARWGRRAFQGVILEGSALPGNFSFSALYGKTDNNGGVSSYIDSLFPNQLYAGKLAKKLGRNSVALNTFNSVAATDSINAKIKGYDAHTVEYKIVKGQWGFGGEIGIGSYRSPNYQRGWSEGINFKVRSPRLFSSIPLEFQFYQIGKNFVNLNTVFFNTSIREAQQTGLVNSQSIFPFNSPMVDIGQLANNRRGVNINTEFKIKRLKLNIGYGNSMEIEKLGTGLSYSHRVNALAYSRTSLFVSNIGPYQRVSTYFRGYFENVNLNDTANGKPLNGKYFNNIELQAKYNLKILNKDIYLFYVGAFNSIQKDISPVTKFTDQAYIRAYYNEFEVYYHLFPKFTLCGYYGFERILGNQFTDLNTTNLDNETQPTFKPRNQIGKGIGFGFDVEIAENAGLYFRQRWFSFRDKNFPNDVYRGNEATLELKVFFF